MPIPPVDRGEIELAMLRFDRELRDSPEWRDWESNRAHRYAIEQDGRHYPVKRVISLATGAAVTEFSGGVGTGASQRLRRSA